jgi:PAS domain S-box-containing protein
VKTIFSKEGEGCMKGKTNRGGQRDNIQLLAVILDTIGDGVIAIDCEWYIVYVNRRAASGSGFTPEELIGQKLWDRFPQLLGTDFEVYYRQAMEKREPQSFVYSEQITCREYSIRIYPSSEGIIATWGDITDHSKAEAALTVSEEKYRSLFNHMNDGFQILELIRGDDGKVIDTIIVDINPAWEKQIGLSRKNVMGKSSTLLFPNPDPIYHVIEGEVESTGKPRRMEAYAAGSGKHIEATYFKLSPGRVGVAFRDITERKKAEEALKKSEEQFRVLFEKSTVGKVITLNDGTMARCNQAFADMLGYSISEMHRNFTQITYPEDIPISQECVRSLLAGEQETYHFEKRYLHRDGSLVWADVSSILLKDSNGIPLYFITSVSNITERKRAEEKLRKSEEKNAFFLRLSDKLRSLSDAKSIQDAATLQLAEHLKVSQSSYTDYSEDNLMIQNETFNDNKLHMKGTYKRGDFSAGIDILCSGRDELRAIWIAKNMRASITVPIFKKGKLVATLSVRQTTPREWKSEEVDLVRETAERTWEAAERVRVENALARAKDDLEIKVKERTEQLQEAYDEIMQSQKDLRDANKQLKQYANKITQVQEEERKRVAYELHDDTAQYLSILKMQIGALANSEEIQNPKTKERLQLLERDADRAFNDVRRYSHELRPTTLEHQGLVAALEQIADDFNKLGQLSVEVHIEGREPELSEEVKLGFFRIAQEALNNCRKHSKASHADIHIRFTPKILKMVVSDNGEGFNTKEALRKSSGKGSLGLLSMRERANLINAELKVESEPGKGTKVILKAKK